MIRPVLDDLYRCRVPSDPQLSPDGTTVVFVVTTLDRTADETVTAVWAADADGSSPPRQLTSGPRDTSPRWSPNGRSLAFLRGVPAQVHLVPPEGGEPVRVTDATSSVSQPAWSPEGSRLAYVAATEPAAAGAPTVVDRLGFKADGVGLRRGAHRHLFVVEVDTGATRQVTDGSFDVAGPAWSPDGVRIAFTADLGADADLALARSVHVVAADGGRATPTGGCGGTGLATGVWWLDGDRLLLTGYAAPRQGHVRLFRMPAAGGPRTELSSGLDRNVMTGAPGYPGASPQRIGDRLVFCARDGGGSHLYVASLDGDGTAAKLVGGADVTVAGASVAGGRIAYVASAATSPGDVWVCDVNGGPGRRITDLAPHGLRPYRARRRVFTAGDGALIEGFILRDDEAPTPGPLLLDIHGGPHNAWSPAFDVEYLYHQVLVARGWTVLLVNQRGSDGYGEDFHNAALGGWGTVDGDDLLAAVDALVDEGVADGDRVAVAGYSYGGYLVCWLTGRTDRFAAAVAGGCIADLVSMVGTSDAGHYLAAYEAGVFPQHDAASIAAMSPISSVARVRTPTLLLHGEEDHTCPVGQAEQWFTALRQQGVPVQLVRYPDGGHLFTIEGRPSQRRDYGERLVSWLERWT